MVKLLALDIANVTGFCTATASGIWKLTPRRDESKGMVLIRLRAKLDEVVKLEGINVVVFERPAGMYASSIISQSEKHGVVKLYCEENGIQYRAYSATEIKKHATGKGNAKKQLMIETAQEKWADLEIIDDNHADALWLFDIAKRDLNIE